MTRDDLKTAIREVLNEGAVEGSDGTWADSQDITIEALRRTFNNTEVIKRQTAPPG